MSSEAYSTPLQMDVCAILRSRIPRLPGLVARWLARLVRERELNGLLAEAFPAAGTDFCRSILRQLNITLKVEGEEHIPASGRLVFASNHPLGGLDGIALIALLGERYGDEGIVFPVNDLLMNVRPLQGVFTPVNKYGRRGKYATGDLRSVFEGPKNVIIFPAGLVSRLGPQGIRDLQWRKTFLTLGAATDRTIVPVHFQAQNRRRFYRLARWRKRLRIPVNIEQAWLPSELVASRDRTFCIRFLPPVSASALLQAHHDARAAAEAMRSSIYDKTEPTDLKN